MKKQIIIPAKYIRKSHSFKTVSIRNPKTGKFKGRKNVGGQGDRTTTKYLAQDYDADHDGKIEANERGGTILGRNPRVEVRASKRARGYVREL